MSDSPKIGDRRLWWIPQLPGPTFYVGVASAEDAAWLCGVLADYDLFQFENKIKPDYAAAGGVEIYTEDGWEGEDLPEAEE